MKKTAFWQQLFLIISIFSLLSGTGVLTAEHSCQQPQHRGPCLTIQLQEQYGKYIRPADESSRDLPCDHTPMGPPTNVEIGSQWDWYIWMLNGPPQAEVRSCTVRGGSDHAWVVVEDSQWNVNVDQTEVDTVLEAFENSSIGQFPNQGIWDLNTSHFGMPPDHLDQDGKIYIVYYDFDVSSDGFFWSFDQGCDGTAPYASNECDALYMNCSDHSPASDYMIAVLAHEFEHVIHYEQDPNESSWVDEGLAELAMWLYGDPDNISAFNTNPDNNLTIWDMSWADYINTYLWTLYFYEQFGGQAAVLDLVKEQANGINGYNAFFVDHGFSAPFAHVFANWTLANYLDNPALANGQYGYTGDTLPPFSTTAQHMTFPVTQSADVKHWATDYVKFTHDMPVTITFDGDATTEFAVWAIEMDTVNAPRITAMELDSQQQGELSFPDLGTGYSDIVMVFAGISSAGGNDYTYTAEEYTPSTPTPTPSPTATPWYGNTPEMRLVLNSAAFQGGDDFILDVDFWNANPEPLEVDAFIVLAVYGEYWFWPSWIHLNDGYDFDIKQLAAQTVTSENILTFQWPEGTGSADGLCFLGAMLDHETAVMYGDTLTEACFGYRD